MWHVGGVDCVFIVVERPHRKFRYDVQRSYSLGIPRTVTGRFLFLMGQFRTTSFFVRVRVWVWNFFGGVVVLKPDGSHAMITVSILSLYHWWYGCCCCLLSMLSKLLLLLLLFVLVDVDADIDVDVVMRGHKRGSRNP